MLAYSSVLRMLQTPQHGPVYGEIPTATGALPGLCRPWLLTLGWVLYLPNAVWSNRFFWGPALGAGLPLF